MPDRKLNVVLATLAALIAIASVTTSAISHPHILATVRAEIVYNDDGLPSALRQSWKYDPAYSAFAIRQADTDGNGNISDAELRAFSDKHGSALAEFNFYTSLKEDGEDVALARAADVGISKDELGLLTFNFTLFFKVAGGGKRLTVDIFDPQFLAYFSMPKEGGVKLANAPASCGAVFTSPAPIDLKNTRSISAVFWAALDGSASASQNFISRINASCR